MEFKRFKNAIFSQGQAPLTSLKTNVKAITTLKTPMETLAKMCTMITLSTAVDMTMMSSKLILRVALAEEVAMCNISQPNLLRNLPSLSHSGI